MIQKMYDRTGKILAILVFMIFTGIPVHVNLKSETLSGVISPSYIYAADEEETDEASEGEDLTDEDAEEGISVSDNMIMVLNGLEEKRRQLSEKEDYLNREEERLLLLKKEIEEKLDRLETVHNQIESSLVKLDAKETEKEGELKVQEEAKLKQLVRVYTNMKPKQAGAIIDKMDIVIAEKLFRRMRGETAGKILSYVQSDKAALISERLAENDLKIQAE